MPAIAPPSSRCAWPAPPMRRSPGPAAASSRSVKALREADEAALVAQSLPRLDALIAEGVDHRGDQVGLRAVARGRDEIARRGAPARRPARRRDPHQLPRRPCLAAGVLGRPRRLCRPHRRRDAAGGPRCRTGRRGRRVLRDDRLHAEPRSPASSRRRKALGLPVKLHADQLSNLGGAALAARYSALSADHLEYADEAGAVAMAAVGNGRRAAARRLLFPARDPQAAGRAVPPPWRADRRRHGLQSRLLAAHLVAAGHEHGRDAVCDDGRGVPRGRHPRGRAGARPGRRDRHAGGRQAGRSRHLGRRASRPSSSTA